MLLVGLALLLRKPRLVSLEAMTGLLGSSTALLILTSGLTYGGHTLTP